MIEINLVPDVKQELIKVQRIRSTVIAGSILVGVVSIGVVSILAFYVFAVQTVRGSVLDGQISKENVTWTKDDEIPKVLTIQNQLSKISDLNSDKLITSRLFDMLVKIIPKPPNNIQISSLKVDSDASTVKIEGQAPNSYAGLEVFKKTMQATSVKFKDGDQDKSVKLTEELSTGETSYGEDSSGNKVLRFTISFKYASELFSPNSKNLSIVVNVSGDGNVSDSYVGIPKNIFVDKAKDIKEGQ